MAPVQLLLSVLRKSDGYPLEVTHPIIRNRFGELINTTTTAAGRKLPLFGNV